MNDDRAILEVEGLTVEFHTPTGIVHAVDDVSFSVAPGKTLAIVGESGSGKTVTVTGIMGLLPKRSAKVSGVARFRGEDLFKMSADDRRALRGDDMAMIFQDPLTSLNPVHRVGAQIVEAIRAHRDMSRSEAMARAVELLDMVGTPNPHRRVKQYPHEFSGGMRQRAMIAMALALDPVLLIADEPTTALDVTVQAQILELIQRLQKEFGTAVIMITHDLGVVASMADEILVMYAGRMVERGTPDQIFYRPQHPYTWGLLGSIPRLDRDVDRLVAIPGLPPNLMRPPPGCPFAPRCDFASSAATRNGPRWSMCSITRTPAS
ncbi:MAG: ABC transporter ATP-binding protein [Actinomycetota bacterium]